MAHHATHEKHGHHKTPWKVLWFVFGTLIFLTIATYLTAEYVDLGPFNIALAMAIAVVKASLVIMFFMALKYDTPINKMVFVVGGLFVFVFIGVTLLDTNFRGYFDESREVTIRDQAKIDRALAERDSTVQLLLKATPQTTATSDDSVVPAPSE